MEKTKNNKYLHAMSGAASGLVSVFALQPLDLIKTRLQQHSGPGSIYKTVSSITRDQGLLGLWRGTWPTVLRNVPGSALYFGFLNESRTFLKKFWKHVPMDPKSQRRKEDAINLLAGGFSRAFAGFILMPATVIKVRYESNLYNYNSTVDAARSIVKHDGVKGLFSGWGATAIRDAPNAGLYVLFYERCKSLLSSFSSQPSGGNEFSSMANMISGISAGFLSTVITQPFDMVKTRIQLEPDTYKNTLQALTKVFREEGFSGYFAGMLPRLTRKVASAAITWVLYEKLLHTFK